MTTFTLRPSVRPDEAVPAGRQRERIRVAAVAAACAVVCLLIGLQRFRQLQLGGFDLGLFDQGIRAYSRFELPRSLIKSVHHGFPPEFSLLGDHFSPILALAAPFYWVWDDPRTLLLVQSLLFGAGVPVVARLVRRECGSALAPRALSRLTLAFCLVYGCGAALLYASRAGFHEVAFAVPLFLLLFERARARAYGQAVVVALLLCLTKEDLGLSVGIFGAVLALRSRRAGDRRGVRTGGVLLVLGPFASLAAIVLFVPWMGGDAQFYWQYSELGASASEALVHVVLHPLDTLRAALTPSAKALLLLWTFGSLLFLPLRSALTLCALPLLAERLFSDNGNHWQALHHYGAFVWPILVAASVETTGRIARRWERRRAERAAKGAAVFAAGITLFGVLISGSWHIVLPSHWQRDAHQEAALTAVRKIPDGVTVEADNNLAPRLTRRTRVMILDVLPRHAEWVLLDTTKKAFPFPDAQAQKDRLLLLRKAGYVVAYESRGVVLLRRPSPAVVVPGSVEQGRGDLPGYDTADVRVFG
ncbi:DUF2079 domain-containing protein [Streptomyces sp. NPDC087440]|uniref:DUF2079 domain-containing protein n=1 Tax=Streptomyces sp. NPDC087440 TaxID=3365790 RepID=UPI0037F2F250